MLVFHIVSLPSDFCCYCTIVRHWVCHSATQRPPKGSHYLVTWVPISQPCTDSLPLCFRHTLSTHQSLNALHFRSFPFGTYPVPHQSHKYLHKVFWTSVALRSPLWSPYLGMNMALNLFHLVSLPGLGNMLILVFLQGLAESRGYTQTLGQ